MMELPEVQDDRKIITIGSSKGVTLSADALESIGVQKGDQVQVVKLPDEDGLRVLPADE